MTWTKGLMAVGAVLSLAVGAASTWKAPWKKVGQPVVISQRGRDQEAFRMVKDAKRTIKVRTESLTMVPFANELAQAQQRGVKVFLDLPLEEGMKDARLGLTLIDLGAVVQWKGDRVSGDHQGTYIEVDGERFLYSAAPLTPAIPGASVGYVCGPISN